MNKISCILSIVFLMAAFGVKAQSPTGTPDSNYSIYKNKLKKSDDQMTDEKKSVNPKFWISRAELMMDIFDLNRKFIAQGTQELQVNLIYQNPLEKRDSVGADGSQYKILVFDKITILMKLADDGTYKVDSFTETKKLFDDPLSEALRCLEKAQELDTEGKTTKSLKEDYATLKKDYERLGIEDFFKPAYKASFNDFAMIDEINEKPIMESAVDTTLLYYAGLAASRANMPEEAIKYYEKARSNNFPQPDLYANLKDKYFEMGDTAKGISVLEEGYKKFPENQQLIIELINYYLLADKAQEALDYLHKAQKGDSTNLSFMFAEATLYDKMGLPEKAKDTYEKCITQDSTYFNAYYNLSVMYYNRAVELYKEADATKVLKEYDALKDSADKQLKKALPFMEKARIIAESNTTWTEKEKTDNLVATLETLKTLYLRLMITDKYQAVIDELEKYKSE
jgi:tetratricopeptide (TPR) repeat protein